MKAPSPTEIAWEAGWVASVRSRYSNSARLRRSFFLPGFGGSFTLTPMVPRGSSPSAAASCNNSRQRNHKRETKPGLPDVQKRKTGRMQKLGLVAGAKLHDLPGCSERPNRPAPRCPEYQKHLVDIDDGLVDQPDALSMSTPPSAPRTPAQPACRRR